jgi:hypothetical protein
LTKDESDKKKVWEIIIMHSSQFLPVHPRGIILCTI